MRKSKKIIIAAISIIVIMVIVLCLCSTKLLFKSVRDCSPNLARFSMIFGADVNGYSEGITPLILSAWLTHDRSCPDVRRLLIESGADVNAIDKNREESSLGVAVGNSDIEMVKLLIDAGADVNFRYSFGYATMLPLHDAIRLGSSQTVIGMVQLLIDGGADVNAIYTFSDDEEVRSSSPLMLAVARDDQNQLVKMLIDAGSDLHYVNQHGDTALHEALRKPWSFSDIFLSKNRLANIKTLIDAGININAQNEFGDTALHSASLIRDEETAILEGIKLLIEAGADVNITDKYGQTALYTAVYCESECSINIEVVKILIKAGAKVNIADSDGDTALHKAARYHNAEIIKLLIDAGADVNITNEKGETAFDICKDPVILEMLKEVRAEQPQDASTPHA